MLIHRPAHSTSGRPILPFLHILPFLRPYGLYRFIVLGQISDSPLSPFRQFTASTDFSIPPTFRHSGFSVLQVFSLYGARRFFNHSSICTVSAPVFTISALLWAIPLLPHHPHFYRFGALVFLPFLPISKPSRMYSFAILSFCALPFLRPS